MKKFIIACTLACASMAALTPIASAHCQIPCGIYDDARVFDELEQHVSTIRRSLRGIAEAKTVHDGTRWTINKEDHAQKIQDRAQAYFLAQRVKVVEQGTSGYGDYQKSVLLLHQIIVAAMKSKQGTDTTHADKLEALIGQYRAHYFKDHGHDPKTETKKPKKYGS